MLLSTGGSTINIVIDRFSYLTEDRRQGVGKWLGIYSGSNSGFLTVKSHSTAKAKVYSSVTRPGVTQLTRHFAGFI